MSTTAATIRGTVGAAREAGQSGGGRVGGPARSAVHPGDADRDVAGDRQEEGDEADNGDDRDRDTEPQVEGGQEPELPAPPSMMMMVVRSSGCAVWHLRFQTLAPSTSKSNVLVDTASPGGTK